MNSGLHSFFEFIQHQSTKLLEQTFAHIGLTFLSLLIALIVGIPAGIFISKKPKYSTLVLAFAGVMQTIPSIALLGFLIPLLGIGAKPAIFALFLYALLPLIRNTYTGISQVDATVIDAARGMGMNERQILLKVQLPLAFPIILAGIRTATVINVGVATLAAYIAAGGLGEFIFGGIALNNTNMILAGAIPAALLAIIFDLLLARVQHIKRKWIHLAIMVLPLMALLLSSFYLVPHVVGSSMLAGFTPEFMGRTDGYLGLKEKYGLNVRTVVISDAVMYKAAYEKKLDVISGYSTDGRLKAFDLVVLQDDKNLFPPYYAAPVVRRDFLLQHPEVEPVLNMLAAKINDSIMTSLNYQVDYLHRLPEEVAKEFLTSIGLYVSPRAGEKGVIRIGSKIFGEQYILIRMYAMLIEGYTDLRAETKTGLGGTKICFDALVNKQIDMYPEYTGTGLLVILQPPANIVDSIINSKEAVYQYVQEAFEQRFGLQWLQPIGFNNAYALMMRKKQASDLHITTISQLKMFIENN